MENTDIKYAVKGSAELEQYFRDNKIKDLAGSNSHGAYWKNSEGIWKYRDTNPGSIIVPLVEYLKITNKDKKYSYSFKDPKYFKAANAIAEQNRAHISNVNIILEEDAYPTCIKIFRNLGVLDIWFNKTEIKPALKLPLVAGVAGEVKDSFLVYGCQKVHVSLFDENNCKLTQLVICNTMVADQEIKQIRAYLLENKYISK